MRAVRPQFMFRSRLVKASDESFIVSERCRRENKIGALSALKNTSYRTTEAMAGVVALDISDDSYAREPKDWNFVSETIFSYLCIFRTHPCCRYAKFRLLLLTLRRLAGYNVLCNNLVEWHAKKLYCINYPDIISYTFFSVKSCTIVVGNCVSSHMIFYYSMRLCTVFVMKQICKYTLLFLIVMSKLLRIFQ